MLGYKIFIHIHVRLQGRGEVETFWLLGHTALKTIMAPGAEGLIGGHNQRIELDKEHGTDESDYQPNEDDAVTAFWGTPLE